MQQKKHYCLLRQTVMHTNSPLIYWSIESLQLPFKVQILCDDKVRNDKSQIYKQYHKL